MMAAQMMERESDQHHPPEWARVTFISPVKVGDILCVYTTVERVGTTSITIAVEAWARRNRLDDRVKVTDGRFVYVALGEDGKKRPLPKA